MRIEMREHGLREAIASFDGWRQPELDKALGRVMLSAARSQVAPIRRETPRGPTGNLAKSISARKAKRGLGAVVGPKGGRGKGAHRFLVIVGTRPHTIFGPLRFGGRWFPFVQHPGSRGNPFVDRAWDGPRMDAFVARSIDRELKKAEKP